MIKKSLLFIIVDLFIVNLIFGILIWIKPGTLHVYLPEYWKPFLVFLFLWFLVSLFSGKYQVFLKIKLSDQVRPVLSSNFIILSVVAIIFFGLEVFGFSRLIVFGTIFFSSLAELLGVYTWYNHMHRQRIVEYPDPMPSYNNTVPDVAAYAAPGSRQGAAAPAAFLDERQKELIVSETNHEVFNYISSHYNGDYHPCEVLSTNTTFNILNQPDDYFKSIINLNNLNDIKRVNKFFEAVNQKLPVGGYYIDSVETNEIKKKIILGKYPLILNYFIYFWYWVFRRLFPKLSFTKHLYLFITNGWDSSYSKAEIYGRLYCCGFELVDSRRIGNKLYFVARKVKTPSIDSYPSYGVLISLKRVGKGGKTIKVYKLRTMHPYAEYIQDLVFRQNNLEEGGKFKNDFRVNTAGRFLRKFWLDELPMLYSVLKGDLKLVGVRPLSRHYFDLYSDDLRARRIRFKPGLIPPFYADMPKTLDEIMDSELKYLIHYERHPFITDIKYFFKAAYNIIFKKARSR